tara:strand:- start:10740 stop:10904 length:165 start_codon:yes stop_codon:yes gene_type:complete
MSASQRALEGVALIVTIAMRLAPIERDLLMASLFALHCRFWPREDSINDDDSLS